MTPSPASSPSPMTVPRRKLKSKWRRQMISDEEALKKLREDCDKCPNCGSDDLSVGDYEGDGLNAASSCHCNDCGMEWTEEYKLYSVTITKGPDYGEVDEPQEEDLVT